MRRARRRRSRQRVLDLLDRGVSLVWACGLRLWRLVLVGVLR